MNFLHCPRGAEAARREAQTLLADHSDLRVVRITSHRTTQWRWNGRRWAQCARSNYGFND